MNEMTLNILKKEYEIKHKKDTDYHMQHLTISSEGKEIRFYRITSGWASLHPSVDLEFDEKAVWEILEILDFIYVLDKQLN